MKNKYPILTTYSVTRKLQLTTRVNLLLKLIKYIVIWKTNKYFAFH